MPLEIRELKGDAEAEACAAMMSGTDPWITLRRSFDDCLVRVKNRDREVYIAHDGKTVRGFIILNMQGAFVGYIQTICVAPDARSGGIGSKLIAFAEERIFRESPNVFLCVSSFNPRARALYERHGYQFVGELRDYVIRGASEFLMRKTRGPMNP